MVPRSNGVQEVPIQVTGQGSGTLRNTVEAGADSTSLHGSPCRLLNENHKAPPTSDAKDSQVDSGAASPGSWHGEVHKFLRANHNSIGGQEVHKFLQANHTSIGGQEVHTANFSERIIIQSEDKRSINFSKRIILQSEDKRSIQQISPSES